MTSRSPLTLTRLVWCASALLVAACAGGSANVDLATVTYGVEAEVTLAEMTRHDRGFYYRDIEVGAGAVAEAGRTVSITYVLRLTDGREIERNDATDPVRFRVGDGTVVDAFDTGVRGMRAGGTRQLVVPPRLAYGARGAGPVPPSAILVMMVRLERVE